MTFSCVSLRFAAIISHTTRSSLDDRYLVSHTVNVWNDRQRSVEFRLSWLTFKTLSESYILWDKWYFSLRYESMIARDSKQHVCSARYMLSPVRLSVTRVDQTKPVKVRMPGPETLHITAGIVQLADHGLHGLVRSCGTPDSLLLTHGLSPTTGQHGGRYDQQPVTQYAQQWVSA